MTKTINDKPIIFDANEVNAVLAGNKTQHRVPVDVDHSVVLTYHSLEAGGAVPERLDALPFDCPFGNVGDQLWVREPFIPDPPDGHDAWEDEDSVTNYFQWDGCGSKLSEIPKRLRKPEHVIYKASWQDPESMVWLSASQMRKWASRILLEITDIRIERVQDISEDDAKAMGLKPDYCDHKYQTCEDIGCIGKWASALFLHLRYEKKLAVHYTDWVWVIEFKIVGD